MALFGSTVDAELEEAGASGNKGKTARKRQMVLMKYFGTKGAGFRDPNVGRSAPAPKAGTGTAASSDIEGPVKL